MFPVGAVVAAPGKVNPFMVQATLSGLVTGSLFALIAVGFNLTFMVNRTVNFAHGQWVALGSLLAFTLLLVSSAVTTKRSLK